MNRKIILLFILVPVVCGFTGSYLYFQLILQGEQSLFKTISVVDSKAMLESVPSILVVDVRSEQEYSRRHLKGAINIPLSDLQGKIQEFDKNSVVLVYCESGRRSAEACLLFAKEGFKKVYNMDGGITAWISSGYPTVP